MKQLSPFIHRAVWDVWLWKNMSAFQLQRDHGPPTVAEGQPCEVFAVALHPPVALAGKIGCMNSGFVSKAGKQATLKNRIVCVRESIFPRRPIMAPKSKPLRASCDALKMLIDLREGANRSLDVIGSRRPRRLRSSQTARYIRKQARRVFGVRGLDENVGGMTVGMGKTAIVRIGPKPRYGEDESVCGRTLRSARDRRPTCQPCLGQVDSVAYTFGQQDHSPVRPHRDPQCQRLNDGHSSCLQ